MNEESTFKKVKQHFVTRSYEVNHLLQMWETPLILV